MRAAPASECVVTHTLREPSSVRTAASTAISALLHRALLLGRIRRLAAARRKEAKPCRHRGDDANHHEHQDELARALVWARGRNKAMARIGRCYGSAVRAVRQAEVSPIPALGAASGIKGMGVEVWHIVDTGRWEHGGARAIAQGAGGCAASARLLRCTDGTCSE